MLIAGNVHPLSGELFVYPGNLEKEGMEYVMVTTAPKKVINKPKRSIWRDRASWELLLLCLPALAGYVIFHYVPLASGLILPFKNYKFAKGILGSNWVGLKNFELLWKSTQMMQILRNTMLYSLWFMFIGPVFNMIIALLLFDVQNRKSLKFYQTVMCFPNFMSMVVVGFITYAILAPTMGIMNDVIEAFGGSRIDVYMSPSYWPFILTVVNLWKGVGMGSMMYFALLMGIDVSLYEAAQIDGANHLQQTWYISIRHLIPLVCIQLILGAGSLVGGNFDLFYNIPRNVPVLYSTTDILPTYVYRALQNGSYVQGAAVSFFQSVAGLILVVTSNLIVRKISPENSLF